MRGRRRRVSSRRNGASSHATRETGAKLVVAAGRMMAELPAWLKRMENGAIGESRARAFLSDRFWILDRSVDVDGADYLIQRRLTGRNFLDETPPRLGVIQAKFLQDARTTHYIDSGYVLDRSGSPYSEFYLLLHSGREDGQRLFLLSASQIAADFAVVGPDKTNAGKFSIPGAALLASPRYEVLDKKRALDRIEHSLEMADFARNRQYLGSSAYAFVSPAVEQIQDDYQVPLDTENYYGDLRDEFFRYKKRVQRTLSELEEVTSALARMVQSSDPIEVLDLYETHVSQHMGAYGLQFSKRELYDDDFFSAALRHKKKLTRLRELGLEGTYLRLRAEYWRWLRTDLWRKAPLVAGAQYVVEVRFDPATLEHGSFSSVVAEPSPAGRAALSSRSEDAAVSVLGPGHMRIEYCVPAALPFTAANAERESVPETVDGLEWTLVEPFVSAMETVVLGLK